MKYYFIFVAVIFFLFFTVKLIFGRKTPTTRTANVVAVKTLPDYASTDADVVMTIDMPVIGHEEHNAVQITINREERTVDLLQGYQGLVIKTESFDNDQASFDVFLRAINSQGFVLEQKSIYKNDRDVCPTGSHYYYDLKNTGTENGDKHLWAVSCGIIGTSASQRGPTIRSLFQKQIPNYQKFLSDAKVSIQ